MIITIIVCLLIILVAIISLYYCHCWSDEPEHQPIPSSLLYEQDKTIIDLFKDISEKYGRYPALKIKRDLQSNSYSPWQTINYSKYYYNSSTFARNLLYCIGPHARTAILSFNRPEWFYSHMGTMIAGGVSVGIYPTASSDNCSFIINHACVDMIVVEDGKQLAKLKDLHMPTVKLILLIDDIHDEFIDTIKNNNKSVQIVSYNSFMDQNIKTVIEFDQIVTQNDTATIIYTSGTTGEPKGVVITHLNIIEALKSALNAIVSRSNINIYIQESFISYLPLNHVAAQMMDIYVPLVCAGVVHFSDFKSLESTIFDVKPTIFIGVPRVWEKIYDKIREQKDPNGILNKLFVNSIILQQIGLDKTKMCITATAPLANEVRKFFSDLGIELCDVYGMSETTGPISMCVPGCSKGSGVPVVDVKINKENSEILVKGNQVFKEYYKDKKATSETFNSKWFKTGDTGYIDRDGSLYVTGRIKDLIITAGGENIAPVPLEEELLAKLNAKSKLFDYAIIIGDRRKFLSVLLVKIKTKTKFNKKLDKHVSECIEELNKTVPNNASTIKKFIIIDDEVDDCLTPTLKIKRSIVDKKYKDKIDELYV